jgi:hypothetical protein
METQQNPSQEETQNQIPAPQNEANQTQANRDYEAEAKANARESQTLRAKLRELEGKVSAAEQEKLSELERAKQEAQAAKERLTATETRVINSELKLAAKDLGFKDPADAIALLNRSDLVIEDGEIRNAKDVMEKLAKSKPYLLAGAPAPSSGRQPGGGGDQVADKQRLDEISNRFKIRR